MTSTSQTSTNNHLKRLLQALGLILDGLQDPNSILNAGGIPYKNCKIQLTKYNISNHKQCKLAITYHMIIQASNQA